MFSYDLLGGGGGDRLAADFFDGAHRFERARHDLRGTRAMGIVLRFAFEQLGVREDDPELIVESMKEQTQFGRLVHRSSRDQFLDAEPAGHACRPLGVLAFSLPDALHGRTVAVVRVAPERVDEDADRSARRANVLDLSAREPVVDRAPAHTDQLAGFHDRNCFAFHLALASREGCIGPLVTGE